MNKFCAAERAFAAYADIEPVMITGERHLMPPRDLAKLLQAADAREGEKALAIAGALRRRRAGAYGC
ncbi:MAG: hypothetical protein ACWGHP_10645 [Stenotrophomonas sp.]